MAPKKAMKAMKALKAMKLGKFAMKAMKAIMKALKAKKKAKRDKQKQMLAAGYIFDGVCPDTGIHWWIHPDDLPFVDRGFMDDQPEPAGPWYLRADPWRHVGSGNPQNPFNDQVELWELESSLEPDDESGDEQPHT